MRHPSSTPSVIYVFDVVFFVASSYIVARSLIQAVRALYIAANDTQTQCDLFANTRGNKKHTNTNEIVYYPWQRC